MSFLDLVTIIIFFLIVAGWLWDSIGWLFRALIIFFVIIIFGGFCISPQTTEEKLVTSVNAAIDSWHQITDKTKQ
jgi:hypothetical protein